MFFGFVALMAQLPLQNDSQSHPLFFGRDDYVFAGWGKMILLHILNGVVNAIAVCRSDLYEILNL